MANVWKIAPGEHASDWDMCRQKRYIGLGWATRLKDYRQFESKKAILKALGGKEGFGTGAAQSVLRFRDDIRPSDIVIANKGRSGVVGIGIVKSEYLPPSSSKNPNGRGGLPHVRLVKWIIDQEIDFKRVFFGASTLTALTPKQVSQIKQAYLKKYPKLKGTLEKLFDGILTGNADDSTTDELASAAQQVDQRGAFDPKGTEDARKKMLVSIALRQGQAKFRKHLLAAYNDRCAITGCTVKAVLEAAHIVPYKGSKTNHPGNGLLLRADLHTLFDLGLVAVDEATKRLLVSPKLVGTVYHKYRGKRIRVPSERSSQPSREALKQHRQKSDL